MDKPTQWHSRRQRRRIFCRAIADFPGGYPGGAQRRWRCAGRSGPGTSSADGQRASEVEYVPREFNERPADESIPKRRFERFRVVDLHLIVEQSCAKYRERQHAWEACVLQRGRFGRSRASMLARNASIKSMTLPLELVHWGRRTTISRFPSIFFAESPLQRFLEFIDVLIGIKALAPKLINEAVAASLSSASDTLAGSRPKFLKPHEPRP